MQNLETLKNVDIFTLSDGFILKHAEAAKALRISIATLYALQAKGDIEPIRLIGKRSKGFTAGSLKAYLRQLNGGFIRGVDTDDQ